MSSVIHFHYLNIGNYILLIEGPFSIILCQIVDPYSCNFTGISSWLKLFCFCIYCILLSWCFYILWQIWRIQELYCLLQVHFFRTQPNWSHFAISSGIYFCYDSEFSLCLVWFIAFMVTTSLTLASGSLLLYFKLCLSCNDVRYSLLLLFHAASLHLCIYFCVLDKSLFTIFGRSLLWFIDAWPKTSKFGVLLCKIMACCLTKCLYISEYFFRSLTI